MTVLVLSGGGLWATAGIGVAAALAEMGVVIDGYVGVSAGALLGGLLALGYSPQEIQEWTRAFHRKDFRVDLRQCVLPLLNGHLPRALFREKRLWRRLTPLLDGKGWDSLQWPLWVVTTSLSHRRPVVHGIKVPVNLELGYRMHLRWPSDILGLGKAIQASMAVPGLFEPVIHQGEVLVDGGILDDYPLDVAAWIGAERIIGVWVDEDPRWQLPATWHLGHLALGSLTTMIRELSMIRQRQLDVPRIDIRIQMDVGHQVFNRIPGIIHQGYQAAWYQQEAIRHWSSRQVSADSERSSNPPW